MDQINFIAGSYYDTSHMAEETASFTDQFSSITENMAGALDSGLSHDSEEMQAAVRAHYDFCLRFWTPDRETYKSLAMNYVLPTGYRDTYEGVREGLGGYIYAAVCYFADEELN